MKQAAMPPIQAIVLDLDGTLYSRAHVRSRMLLELAREFVRHPGRQYHVGRFLYAYRKAQEELRRLESSDAGDQLSLACRRTGADPAWARAVVDEWMDQRPLRFLARAIRPDLSTFLAAARRRGIRLGLCSDYPADRKLHALGIRDAFDAVVSAHDPSVKRFKPDPAGLLTVMAALDARPNSVVYVGDRPDVDAEAARRAGVRAFILSSTVPPSAEWVGVKNFAELGVQLGVMTP